MSYSWKLMALTAIVVAHIPMEAQAGCRRCCRILCRCGLHSGSPSGGESKTQSPESSTNTIPTNPSPTTVPGQSAGTTGVDLASVETRLRHIEQLLRIKTDTERTTAESALFSIALERLLNRLGQDLSRSVDNNVNQLANSLIPPPSNQHVDQTAITEAIKATFQTPEVTGLIRKSITDSYESDAFKAAVKANSATGPGDTATPSAQQPQSGK